MRGYRTQRSVDYPTIEATCSRGEHRAPKPECGCGYNAYSEPAGAVEYREYGIMSEVWGYGKVDVYSHGFRARRMQALAFFQPVCSDCKKPAEVATRDHSLNFGKLSWLGQINFYCKEHAAIDPMSIAFSVEAVVGALSSKYEAGVYSLESSIAALENYYSFRGEVDSSIYAADRIEQERREANRARQQLRKQGAGAQMGMAF